MCVLDYQRRRASDRWIPVAERLPDECVKVLACFDDSYGGTVILVTREGDKWFDESLAGNLHQVYCISHWRPIPASHNYDSSMSIPAPYKGEGE